MVAGAGFDFRIAGDGGGNREIRFLIRDGFLQRSLELRFFERLEQSGAIHAVQFKQCQGIVVQQRGHSEIGAGYLFAWVRQSGHEQVDSISFLCLGSKPTLPSWNACSIVGGTSPRTR